MQSTGPGFHRGRFPRVRQTEVVRRGKEKGHRQLRLQEAAGRGCPGQFHGEVPQGECTRPAAPSRRRPRPPERCPPLLLALGLCVWQPGRSGPVPGRELPGLPRHLGFPTLFSVFLFSRNERTAYSRAPPRARSGLPAGGQRPHKAPPWAGRGAPGRVSHCPPRQFAGRSAGRSAGPRSRRGSCAGGRCAQPRGRGECAQL